MALSRFVVYLDTPQESRLAEFGRVVCMILTLAILPAAIAVLVLRLFGVS